MGIHITGESNPGKKELLEAFDHAYDHDNPKTVTFTGKYIEFYGGEEYSADISIDFRVEGLRHIPPRDGFELRIFGHALNIPELDYVMDFSYDTEEKYGYIRLVNRTADVRLYSVISPRTVS